MSKPPLWEVMTQARYNSEGARLASIRHATAAEIRAVRDWLVPEQLEPEEPVGYGIGADCGEFTDQWARWHDRQHLRDLLTAEADRAEKGEVEG